MILAMEVVANGEDEKKRAKDRNGRIVERTLHYLSAGKAREDEAEISLTTGISQAIRELDENAKFRLCYEIYALRKLPADCIKAETDEKSDIGAPENKVANDYYIPALDLTLPSKDLNTYFEGCDRVCVIASTLGIETEKYLRRETFKDTAHGMILDATAGAYLEIQTDEEETEIRELAENPRTFRFAPGYGDLPLALNIPLSKALDTAKRLGMSHTSGGLFVPQKSMLGLIGIGKERLHRECGRCERIQICEFRKNGERCFL